MIKILRSCPSCGSEDVQVRESGVPDAVLYQCGDCNEIWREQLFPVQLPSDPLESRLLKWRPKR